MFFPADLPYEKWPHVSGVFTLMQTAHQTGDWGPVAAYYNDPANTSKINDAIGAGNYWYNKVVPGGYPVVLESGELTHGTPVPFTTKPGKAQAFKSTVDGLASASIGEGGEGLYGMVSASLPTTVAIDQFITWGKVAVEGLAIKAGQYLVIYSQSPNALSGCKADTRV